MATLVSEIILQAFRACNYIAVGETPTPAEQDEALPVFRNLLSSLFGFEIGEQLRDWFAPSDYISATPLRSPLTPSGINEPNGESWAFPSPNVRLIVTVGSATTIYFPANPNDGARISYVAGSGTSGIVTLNGNGRKIEGAATVVAAAADTFEGRHWMYRADLANWIRIDQVLVATDTVPLPPEFDDLLVTGLAIRFAPRFQVQIDNGTAARFGDMLARLKKRYKQTEQMPASTEFQQTMREL